MQISVIHVPRVCTGLSVKGERILIGSHENELQNELMEFVCVDLRSSLIKCYAVNAQIYIPSAGGIISVCPYRACVLHSN